MVAILRKRKGCMRCNHEAHRSATLQAAPVYHTFMLNRPIRVV